MACKSMASMHYIDFNKNNINFLKEKGLRNTSDKKKSLHSISHELGFYRCYYFSSAHYKKGTLHSQPQVITFTSCLPMAGASLRVLRLLSTTKTGHHDIAEILLKVSLNTKINQAIKYLGFC